LRSRRENLAPTGSPEIERWILDIEAEELSGLFGRIIRRIADGRMKWSPRNH
jgi:hypothetical protein